MTATTTALQPEPAALSASLSTSLPASQVDTSVWPHQLRPSTLDDAFAKSFTSTEPFTKFGEWGPTIQVARRGYGLRLARWLALNRARRESWDNAWSRCREENPAWFRSHRIVRMLRPSFFLPAGEVVFEVTERFTQVPDNPPRGVLLRHLEAMTAAPGATFYFLRPTFTTVPYFRLYSAQDLREDAEIDRGDAIFAARLYGWAFRAVEAARRTAIAGGRLALRGSIAAVSTAAALLRKLAGNGGLDLRNRRDAQVFAELLETELAGSTIIDSGTQADELRRAIAELRFYASIDPVLCFETPDRPGELWFEAHWYEGQSGRTYVHY
ncbi:MAG: hypothetical protein AAGA92_06425 [Planctomycetota bacterium]